MKKYTEQNRTSNAADRLFGSQVWWDRSERWSNHLHFFFLSLSLTKHHWYFILIFRRKFFNLDRFSYLLIDASVCLGVFYRQLPISVACRWVFLIAKLYVRAEHVLLIYQCWWWFDEWIVSNLSILMRSEEERQKQNDDREKMRDIDKYTCMKKNSTRKQNGERMQRHPITFSPLCVLILFGCVEDILRQPYQLHSFRLSWFERKISIAFYFDRRQCFGSQRLFLVIDRTCVSPLLEKE